MASPFEVYDPTIKKAQKDSTMTEINGAILEAPANEYYNHDPIGLPDAQDIENIKAIFRRHELAHPGEIDAYAADAKNSRAAALSEYGMTNMGAARRVFSMPTPLLRTIEEAYPLMFRNKKHMRWFAKEFPQFNCSNKQT